MTTPLRFFCRLQIPFRHLRPHHTVYPPGTKLPPCSLTRAYEHRLTPDDFLKMFREEERIRDILRQNPRATSTELLSDSDLDRKLEELHREKQSRLKLNTSIDLDGLVNASYEVMKAREREKAAPDGMKRMAYFGVTHESLRRANKAFAMLLKKYKSALTKTKP